MEYKWIDGTLNHSHNLPNIISNNTKYHKRLKYVTNKQRPRGINQEYRVTVHFPISK